MNESKSSQSEVDETTRSDYPGPWLHWAALAAAIFTWPLLISGGDVTTHKVGMAVPDWPSTFGENMFLYDFWNASVGVFKEHRHRLMGAGLGFALIVLTVLAVRFERRRWIKQAVIGALVGVCVQGLLGGLRVRWNSLPVAEVHACSAQAVFALLVAITVWSGRGWSESARLAEDEQGIRRASFLVLAIIYFQIVMGAWLRHFPSPLSATVHALVAVGVFGYAGSLIWRIEKHRSTLPSLVPSARMMAALLLLQIILGIVSFWVLLPFDGVPRSVGSTQAFIRTGHQANGALVLASAVVLSLRAYSNLRAIPRSSEREIGTNASTSGLEAVS